MAHHGLIVSQGRRIGAAQQRPVPLRAAVLQRHDDLGGQRWARGKIEAVIIRSISKHYLYWHTVCVYVCLSVCMYVCICMYAYVNVNVYVYVNVCVCMCSGAQPL